MVILFKMELYRNVFKTMENICYPTYETSVLSDDVFGVHLVLYKMGLLKMFDVMFNFQHKSDHNVHISHFTHTGQAHMGPSFSAAIGPLLPHGLHRPSRPAWDPLWAHLMLFRNITSI